MFADQRIKVLAEVGVKGLEGIDAKYFEDAKAKAENQSKLPSHFIELNDWTLEVAKEAQPVIELIAKNEGRQLLTRLGATPEVFAVFDRNVPEAAQDLALKFCESTNETTSLELDDALSKVRDEVGRGAIEGDTRTELTNRINEIFDKAEGSRAETIARTEASRAAHMGELMSAKESGVVRMKKWLASSDACPLCDDVAAKGAIPIEEPFTTTDYGDVNGPPLHPNCQCSQTLEVTDAV